MREGASDSVAKRTEVVHRIVGGLGILNLIANASIAAVTAILATEASRSARFSFRSRRLP